MVRIASIWLAVLVTVAWSAHAQDIIEGVAEALDGDTLKIGEQRLRLYGVDAFELDQQCWNDGTPYPCGEIARDMLAGLLGRAADGGSTDVWCLRMPVNRDGLAVAKCLVGRHVDLGAVMVGQGFALAYPPESDFYSAEEFAAQLDARGSLGHSYHPPWEWRRMTVVEKKRPPK